jgi:hypothetical protein
MWLSRALAREDVDLMAAALQSGGQLGDVDANAAHRDRMKGFPREQSNSHFTSSPARTRTLETLEVDRALELRMHAAQKTTLRGAAVGKSAPL